MLKRILSVVSFDTSVIAAVAADEDARSDAYLVLLFVALVNAALMTAFPVYFDLPEIFVGVSGAAQLGVFLFLAVFGYLFTVAGVWVGAWIYHAVASLLGGSGSAPALFRAVAFASPLGLLTNLPFVGWIVNVWVVALYVALIHVVEQLSVGRAVGVVAILLGALFLLLLSLVFLALFAGVAASAL